jgi:hypothetical protein
MDDLEGMEEMLAGPAAGGAGETPPHDTPALQVTPVSTPDGQASSVGKSGYDIVADLLPVEQHKAFGGWCMRYKLSEDDPFYGGKLATNVAFNSAAAAQRAVEYVIDGVAGIPAIVQKAATGASNEVAGQIDQALKTKIPDFANAIKLGVMKGTEGAIASLDGASKQLADAAGKFDSDVDKTVIARRDAVLASWVQNGSDALEKRMSEAVKRERIFNVYLLLFLSGSMFVGGIVLGMHLHF